jgi:hypothetical protein
LYIGVLVANLIEGAGAATTLPRPVVKQTKLAPPATCPVAATGMQRAYPRKTTLLGDGPA